MDFILNRELTEFLAEEIVGLHEIGELVIYSGASKKQYIDVLTTRHGFPSPITRLSRGRLWYKSQVIKFLREKNIPMKEEC